MQRREIDKHWAGHAAPPRAAATRARGAACQPEATPARWRVTLRGGVGGVGGGCGGGGGRGVVNFPPEEQERQFQARPTSATFGSSRRGQPRVTMAA